MLMCFFFHLKHVPGTTLGNSTRQKRNRGRFGKCCRTSRFTFLGHTPRRACQGTRFFLREVLREGFLEGAPGMYLECGRKKEPKPKLFGPDIFQRGRDLPRERVGAKKFDTSLETREIKLFGQDIPGFCRDIPGAPEKFEKKIWVPLSFPIEVRN